TWLASDATAPDCAKSLAGTALYGKVDSVIRLGGKCHAAATKPHGERRRRAAARPSSGAGGRAAVRAGVRRPQSRAPRGSPGRARAAKLRRIMSERIRSLLGRVAASEGSSSAIDRDLRERLPSTGSISALER